jgi:hypothetical protein
MKLSLEKSVTENLPSHTCNLTASNGRNIKVFKVSIEGGEYPLRLAPDRHNMRWDGRTSAHNPTASKTTQNMTRIQTDI